MRIAVPLDAEIPDTDIATDRFPPLASLIPEARRNHVMMGLDPGETTGCTIMQGAEVLYAEQLRTKDLDISAALLNKLIRQWDIYDISCEDYKVYAWESEKHKWAALHTPKLIGVIAAVAWFNKAQVTYRMAVTAKQFVTDEKLVAWNLWKKGQRHSRDAIRHAVYHQIFGPKAGTS
jgi:hypothetical protein